ncbi:unnamed protein product [Pleuronectes platessa]|uniref:Uncharacterized protein n=1 Tax=Pleuronectes platessa TaxID=8262 RepID=A0A9N7UG60_PLEPL|nr:unnamed protein product [Pleuronectes platessa]
MDRLDSRNDDSEQKVIYLVKPEAAEVPSDSLKAKSVGGVTQPPRKSNTASDCSWSFGARRRSSQHSAARFISLLHGYNPLKPPPAPTASDQRAGQSGCLPLFIIISGQQEGVHSTRERGKEAGEGGERPGVKEGRSAPRQEELLLAPAVSAVTVKRPKQLRSAHPPPPLPLHPPSPSPFPPRSPPTPRTSKAVCGEASNELAERWELPHSGQSVFLRDGGATDCVIAICRHRWPRRLRDGGPAVANVAPEPSLICGRKVTPVHRQRRSVDLREAPGHLASQAPAGKMRTYPGHVLIRRGNRVTSQDRKEGAAAFVCRRVFSQGVDCGAPGVQSFVVNPAPVKPKAATIKPPRLHEKLTGEKKPDDINAQGERSS